MVRRMVSLISVGISALTCIAGEYDDVKADSMVYDKPTEWKIYSAGGPVHAFAVQKDLLWCATDDGVVTISLKKNDLQKFAKLGSIPSTEITSMITDNAGRVWFGSKNGTAFRNGNEFTSFTSENGLPDNAVNALCAGSDGAVWAATDKGAAAYQSGNWRKYGTADGLAGEKVQAVAIDGNGSVWLGTNKGISVLKGGKWTTYNMKQGKLSWNDVKAIGIDQRKKTVWAAVGEKDVNAFDGEKWNTFMDIQPGIMAIMADTQSRIWFGSLTGLVKFNGDEWITDPKQHGIPVAQVSAMHRDEGGNLWFAMESGVLRMANPYPY